MTNKIEFVPGTETAELLIQPPKPAKLCIPKWFKDIPGINSNNIKIDKNGTPNLNIKNCVPFLDSITAGYIQESWTDISIEADEDGDVVYNQASKTAPEIMSHREKTHVPVKDFFYNFEFIWKQYWMPKLPKGYSYFFTHPLGRIDLPFYTMSAIVDGDGISYTHGGNVPFYIRKGFTGIIPEGTPLYQIIPFKRESWQMFANEYNEKLSDKGIHDLRKRFIGSYKKIYWNKKIFE